MISHEMIRNLEKIRSDAGVISLYLRFDPQMANARDLPGTEFKGLLKRTLAKLNDERHRAALEREKDRLLAYLKNWVPSGRGIALFACEPAGLFEALTLNVLVPTSLEVNSSPKTTVLLQILDEFPRLAVVTVHRDQASIYITEQRQSDKTTEIASEVQGWHSQGGWSQARFQRHIEYQVHEHLKKVADDLERRFYADTFNRFVIGGAEQTVLELIHMLSDPLRQRLIGTFAIDSKHETEDAILEKARQVLVTYERATEKGLIEQIIDAAHAGGPGVLGIEATLPIIIEGRVQTLVIAEGTTREGVACLRCDYLSTQPFKQCPICGGPAEVATDIVDRAAEKAYLTGAHVETVLGEARDKLLTQGGIGALLRY